MTFARAYSQLSWPLRVVFSLILLLAESITVIAACSESITSGNATGQASVAFTYQITATHTPQSYNALNLPPGLTVNTSSGLISGTPTSVGTYTVTLQATYPCGTIPRNVTFTINYPTFAGFRLPDFTLGTGSPNRPWLMLQMGANGTATVSNRFNATLEVDASGNGTAWVPYNHFIGVAGDINNTSDGARASWITDAPLHVRDATNSNGSPLAFSRTQLTQFPPGVYMKADPRASRFGILQMDTTLTTSASRILLPPWPSNDTNVKNGFGGNVADPGGPVEHAPNRFSSAAYYPATFSINGPPDARDNATTTYADNDSVTRSADAKYANSTYTGFGSSTPYNTSVYSPIILNRPFRNVAELGYAFRDLPWKTLDFFSDKSADAGLLDIFSIHDGPRATTSYNGTDFGNVVPTTVAGKVNLDSVYLDPNNSALAPVGQPILAGALWDDSSSTVAATGPGDQTAQTMTSRLVTATSATRMQNKSELITRVDPVTGAKLVETILPPASNDNQAVKARREVVARGVSSASQTRVWNVVIDVVAQTGHYKSNASSLQNDFVVEGEQHYWVHVAIDRFTGHVLDRQVEVVKE